MEFYAKEIILASKLKAGSSCCRIIKNDSAGKFQHFLCPETEKF